MGDDPAGLGRGPLTRRLPVYGQAAPDTPTARPYVVAPATTPRRFFLQVIFSVTHLTVPAAVCATLLMVAQSLVPVIVGAAIDRALATGDHTQMLFWSAVLAVNVAVLALCSRFAQQLTVHAAQLAQLRLRATLSRAVLHPTRPARRRPDGSVVSLMTNDVQRTAMVGLGVFALAEILAIAFIAAALLFVHWPLGIVALVGAVVALWLTSVLSGRFTRDSRVYQGLLADTVGRATDLVHGYRVIKGMRAETEATRRYRAASRETLRGAHRNQALLGRFIGTSGAVSRIYVAVVAALAGLFAVQGALTVGGLIAAVGLAQALLPQLFFISRNAVPGWVAGLASSSRVLDVLSAAAERSSGPDRASEPVPAGATVEITVPGQGVVRAGPGQMVGVRTDDRTAAAIAETVLDPHGVDERGDPSDGSGSGVGDVAEIVVRIGGVPAHLLDPAAYREHLLVAPHHATLFSGTVADNLDVPGASCSTRAAALQAAACDDFVADPARTELGEQGNRLSGGQAQRVALARALARDAPVLLLHDPTTAVDPMTEGRISRGLAQLRRDRTTVLIAASPALLEVCDQVTDLRPAPDEAAVADASALR
ncbi:bifunctional ABC transporter [Pseudonocardia sp. Ae168_Ps1]|uniref:ABC transporter transmembrane domain-containing protein n=1 Tax=unclassified Pseudonocardia TaxID=2619320 RepID=UPI00094ABEAC|nr:MULTISPECIES: ABC transporter ATP-binding protein [unclassified Pseudonocardia]OLL73497.1 bifunctional ABC transporter [Pseudonocardia sp. Ae150A_Ps1]OLL79475.1 bifunctional ABC transporter [Pseudonocardia sp. Ae168_Ps1]OLL86391.1 bifunctional ABC transporter [Pseudonocardia sp. Ae263_Ps1]OLL93568.1 bifunctional ABC transporter [Pseudonocardia sp. Ae356_Ps1]